MAHGKNLRSRRHGVLNVNKTGSMISWNGVVGVGAICLLRGSGANVVRCSRGGVGPSVSTSSAFLLLADPLEYDF